MKKNLDWLAIEGDYRAGIMTLRAMGSLHGVSAPAILKRAKRDKWERDLGPAIHAAAEAKVYKAAVNTVNKSVNSYGATFEEAVVEENAELRKNVILGQRKTLGRAFGVFRQLLDELEALNRNIPALEGFAEIAAEVEAGMRDGATGKRTGDASSSANQARFKSALATFKAAISLSTRATIMQRLADSLRSLVAMEREAFGLSKGADDGKDDVVAALRALGAG